MKLLGKIYNFIKYVELTLLFIQETKNSIGLDVFSIYSIFLYSKSIGVLPIIAYLIIGLVKLLFRIAWLVKNVENNYL